MHKFVSKSTPPKRSPLDTTKPFDPKDSWGKLFRSIGSCVLRTGTEDFNRTMDRLFSSLMRLYNNAAASEADYPLFHRTAPGITRNTSYRRGEGDYSTQSLQNELSKSKNAPYVVLANSPTLFDIYQSKLEKIYGPTVTIIRLTCTNYESIPDYDQEKTRYVSENLGSLLPGLGDDFTEQQLRELSLIAIKQTPEAATKTIMEIVKEWIKSGEMAGSNPIFAELNRYYALIHAEESQKQSIFLTGKTQGRTPMFSKEYKDSKKKAQHLTSEYLTKLSKSLPDLCKAYQSFDDIHAIRSTPFLLFVTIKQKEKHYILFSDKHDPFLKAVIETLTLYAEALGFPIGNRASFGFKETHIDSCGYTIRIKPGALETRERIHTITRTIFDFLNQLGHEMGPFLVEKDSITVALHTMDPTIPVFINKDDFLHWLRHDFLQSAINHAAEKSVFKK